MWSIITQKFSIITQKFPGGPFKFQEISRISRRVFKFQEISRSCRHPVYRHEASRAFFATAKLLVTTSQATYLHNKYFQSPRGTHSSSIATLSRPESRKCTKFGQMILKKIIKIVASRCQILRRKCTKFDFGWGSAPDPAGGAYSAPPDPLAGFKGAYTSKGKEGRGRKGGEGGEGRDEEQEVKVI